MEMDVTRDVTRIHVGANSLSLSLFPSLFHTHTRTARCYMYIHFFKCTHMIFFFL